METEQLFSGNLGLVYSSIKKSHLHTRFPHEDAVQVGLLALFEAATRFDPEKGKFSTYAVRYIHGRIIKASVAMRLLCISPSVVSTVGSARKKFRWFNGREPTIKELIQKLPKNKPESIVCCVRALHEHKSLDAPIPEGFLPGSVNTGEKKFYLGDANQYPSIERQIIDTHNATLGKRLRTYILESLPKDWENHLQQGHPDRPAKHCNTCRKAAIVLYFGFLEEDGWPGCRIAKTYPNAFSRNTIRGVLSKEIDALRVSINDVHT